MGKLYLVPTPIGNLKDITLRALEVLNSVDIIAAEDTRHSLKLLNNFNIKKTLISYHKFNENDRSSELIQRVINGENIAIITDAGMPGISDPGSVIVKKCIEQGVHFEVLPGASASVTALIYSGLNTEGFIFRGFLPRENKDRKAAVKELQDRWESIIIYEAPHRLRETLAFVLESFGDRKLSICRELTKVHEEILRLTAKEACEYYNNNEPRGEYVIVIEGKSKQELKQEEMSMWENISIKDHILKYIDEGMEKKEAIKAVAKDRNIPKSEVYKYSIDL